MESQLGGALCAVVLLREGADLPSLEPCALWGCCVTCCAQSPLRKWCVKCGPQLGARHCVRARLNIQATTALTPAGLLHTSCHRFEELRMYAQHTLFCAQRQRRSGLLDEDSELLKQARARAADQPASKGAQVPFVCAEDARVLRLPGCHLTVG